ncbi:MAG: hypothetical protein IJ038_03815 [Clostridia bacterium]|nr:hypothetical protein [Clostridia bacterium]
MKKIKYIAPELEKISFSSSDVLLASLELASVEYDDSNVSANSGMRW